MANPGVASSLNVNTQAVMNGIRLLFVLRSANMQLTADQIFTRRFFGAAWDPTFITAVWTSGAFSGACAGGIYSAASKGGSAIVASAQSYSGLTGALTQTNCTVLAATTTFLDTPFLSLTTGNGAALTADIRIYGVVYDDAD
jgi:hypothetical protein